MRYDCQVRYSHFYPRPPRGGRPSTATPCTRRLRYFYPRPPRGGRQWLGRAINGEVLISTHALREEGDMTASPCREVRRRISTHALREEGDLCGRARFYPGLYFYPRPPRGGRLWHQAADRPQGRISTHALREEGDQGRNIRPG